MSANFLEQLASEWYSYKGYFVRQNVLVGKRAKGGYECELDVVAFNPETKHLIHMEPSMDCYSWGKREKRYLKKFQAGRKYIPALFRGTALPAEIEQIALLEYASNKKRDKIGGGKVLLVKEFIKAIKKDLEAKMISNNAVSEHMPLLRMIQFMCHYHDFIYTESTNKRPVASDAASASRSPRTKVLTAVRGVGMEKFVEFYYDFKSAGQIKTMQRLQDNGDKKTSAQIRWAFARSIFKNNWQEKALESVSNANRVKPAVRSRAQELLVKERAGIAHR
ncbi:MAG: hypothetical protein WC687_04465 [Patescibacteria group bacterium]|jgi:hypothetical protein